jgi:peroxiredoxin Q/BCP
MIAVGDVAPEFETRDDRGETVRSTHYRGRRLILFFYPKAGSAGCTREALGFAQSFSILQDLGVQVVGISVDSADAQRLFSNRCKLPYPVLSDSSGEIARRYGVLGMFGFARRVTFLIGSDGRIVHVTESLLPGAHVRDAMEIFGKPAPLPPWDRRPGQR